MKVWITKYALTSGVFESEAELCDSISPEMIKLARPGRYPEHFHGNGKEWHLTKESAIDRVVQLKVKKIASLKKTIKKIEAITI